ncbi:MAG: glyoxylate/hydroxypyruvate reductase A [Hyphomonadaceae bacterium]|jgi:glyoxylate/hydroxypyruvate reductase A|nr:glyoxylate/hydroxypyruvate reductase A [Hyphomonadaceae bacterium]
MALLIACSSRAEQFAAEVQALDPELDIRIAPDLGRPEDIDTALVWQPPPGLLRRLPNLKLIVSVGAGVDALLGDPTLPYVPLVRFVDADLTARMVEYVVLNVLYHHRRMAEFRELQTRGVWKYLPEPAAHDVRVGVMGLGVLGEAAVQALKPFGYQMRGWSRTPKALDGVVCHHGTIEREAFLAETDILVVLLPLTPDTRGILNRPLLRGLSRRGRSALLPGPVLINAGRGGLQVDADVSAALNAGELYAASLDVFEREPLPADSPLWSHPRVVVTPHNAAESAPAAIARYALRQMRAQRQGQRLENLVHRARGY